MVMGRKYLNFIGVGSMLLFFLTNWHTLVSDIIRKYRVFQKDPVLGNITLKVGPPFLNPV